MRKNLALALILASLSGTAGASVITLDGVLDGASYSTSEAITWFNGHKTEHSIYGDFADQLGVTTIRYGAAELAGDSSGDEFFFLYIDVPLYAKNMIWQDKGKDGWKTDYPISNTDPTIGLTEADVRSYRVHHETHHDPGDMKLDFDGATKSEKLVIVDSKGKKKFEADLGDGADSSYGLIGFKDSTDYLLDTGFSTKELSLARNTKMSFEFQFKLDTKKNSELLGLVRNGIEFHLSPERGLHSLPEPGSMTMFAGLIGLISCGFFYRRFRRHV